MPQATTESMLKIQADLWMTVPGWKERLDEWNNKKPDEERWAEGIAQLKKMAIAGEPRPKEKTVLGRLLYRITAIQSGTRGGGPFPVAIKFPNAHAELIELAPKWFRKKAGQKRTISNASAEEKISALWEMAKKQKAEADAIVEGKYQYARPPKTEELGNALTNYTNKKNKAYKPDFDEAIRKFIPEWFHQSRKESRRKLWEAQKKELLNMVRRGEKKPSKEYNKKHHEHNVEERKLMVLAFALRDFTRKAFQKRNGVLQQNPKYDPDFTKEIIEENRIYQAGWTFGSDEPNVEFAPKRKYATAG